MNKKKYYIDYDEVKSFLDLIKVCDYGGVLYFPTDKEFEASQITIDVIENKIDSIKKELK